MSTTGTPLSAAIADAFPALVVEPPHTTGNSTPLALSGTLANRGSASGGAVAARASTDTKPGPPEST